MNNPPCILRSFLIPVFSLVMMAGLAGIAHSQSGSGLSGTDLSRVEASDISDEQLRSYVNRARQEGLTEDEAFRMARQRGLRSSVANELRQRIRELGLDRETAGSVDRIDDFREDRLSNEYLRPPRIETFEMRRTFGSQIFRDRTTEFSPLSNLPTPVSYTLGPGDELAVNIWGDQTNTYRLRVSPEGTVDIDNLGPIYVSGLTIEEANDRIIRNLQQLYSGLRPDSDNQTTFARVSIDRLRSIQVAMIGEVTNPGDYSVTANSTVFNALYRAGGPNENGSYRSIRVIRNNEVVADLDLYDFLVDGLQTDNIRLRNHDVIHVTPYRNRVEVQGEVKRGGLYFETKEGETFSDLIRFAGGFTERAYTRHIRVHRNTPSERRIITVDGNQLDSTPVMRGDVVHVDEILDRFENRVSISGAVWRSGDFELREGMMLSDLIREADGVRPDAFLSRGLINRVSENYMFEQISFDVNAVLENPERFDIPLQREDHIRIRSIHDMADEQVVDINGAVRNSGSFRYRSGMTLEDLILKADGLLDEASEARIEISRRIIGEPAPEERSQDLAEIFTFDVDRNLELRDEDRAFRLEPFDKVFVHNRPDYREQITVRIEGEVMYPGTYTIRDRNERVSDVIARAGGLTSEAYTPGARLIRQISSIDRPEIDLDFLSEEEQVDKESLGFGMFEEREREERLQEERERDDERAGSPGGRTGKEDSELAEARGTLEERAELNRQNRIEEEEEQQVSDRERRQNERRIGIDLVSILQSPGSSDDLFLRDGDVIRIPHELQTVGISGAVMQDVEVRFQRGRSLGYYIDRAGGYSENARAGRAYVVYANGDVDRRKRYLFGLIKSSPDIEPGAQIIVPAKSERARMDTGELISVSAAIVGMTTSLLITIDRLSR